MHKYSSIVLFASVPNYLRDIAQIIKKYTPF